MAREVWILSSLLIETQGVHFPEFIDLLWHLKFIQQMGNDLLELVIATSWSMWFNRNIVRQGKTRQLAAMVLQKARMLLDEFQVANAQPSKALVSDTACWTNPTSPWYKINVDGMDFEQQEASGVGVVVRDH